MATKDENKNKNKKEVKESEIQGAKSLIEANHYNFTTDNIQKAKKIVTSLDAAVNKFITEHSKSNPKSIYSNVNALLMDSIAASVNKNSELHKEREEIAKQLITPGGIRSIGDLSTANPYEQEVIDVAKEISSNAFVQFNEFKAVCTVIPELGKVIKMYAREILNVNDVTKEIFTDFFHEEDFEDDDEYDDEVIKSMNEEFRKKVVENNELEDKVKRYVRESLTKGCNPVSVIPYKEILYLIQQAAINSGESIDNISENLFSEENLLTPTIRETASRPIMNAVSYENYDKTEYSIEPDTREYDDIINESLSTEEYLESFIDTVRGNEDMIKHYSDLSTEDTTADIDELKRKLTDEKIYEKIKEEAKPFLMSIIDQTDSRVSVVDHTHNRNLLSMARKTLEKTLKFKDFVAKDGEITIHDMVVRRDDIPVDSNKIHQNDTKYGGKGDVYNKESEVLDKLMDSIDDVLITEHDAPSTIPFIINGKHVGYWVFETDSNDLMRSKRNFLSFTDIIKSLGYNDDMGMTAGGIAGAPSVITTMMGNSHTGHSITALSGAALGGLVGYGVSNTEDGKRIEMMKDLVVRTVAKRIKNSELASDKSFRDAMINLMRQGYIIKKKIRITYIPAEYMVYFPYETDEIGLPKPLFANTLMWCYLYISSRIQSLMIKMYKSSNKEIISFNVGANKNIGTSVRTIDRILSTRDTYSATTFRNLASVMKNSVAHQRLIIPIINSEKLFDFEEMQKINDISIDDEYTQQLLDSILSVTPIPPSMINKLDEDEYSRSIISQHLNYMNGVIDGQAIYNKEINKLLKVIAKHTKFEDPRIHKQLDKMEFRLAIPNKLNITNISNSFQDNQTYIDNMVTYLFANDAENELYTRVVNEFRLSMAKMFIPEADWNSLEKLKDKIFKETETRILEERIRAKFAEKNQEAASDASLGAMGGGGGGGAGGGMGGEEGGDEEGGGEDDMGMGLDNFDI